MSHAVDSLVPQVFAEGRCVAAEGAPEPAEAVGRHAGGQAQDEDGRAHRRLQLHVQDAHQARAQGRHRQAQDGSQVRKERKKGRNLKHLKIPGAYNAFKH